MQRFKALRVHRTERGIASRLEEIGLDDLAEGEVVLRAAWSDVNYKDALAVTGAGRIMRSFPMVAGIDVSGTVQTSTDPRFSPGDRVLVTGCGLGESHDGGYAEIVRVPADWLVRVPDGLDLRQVMQIGTAGFTAALAVELMQRNEQRPEHGPIAVTGATGGVGSLAIDMLSGLGFEVHAITGKADEADYLRGLGAAEVLARQDLELGTRPLEKARWGGAVDNLGGEMLAWLTRTVKPFGNVASIGLAASHELHGTVMPFILRGVNLLGINSVLTPAPLRQRVWERLAGDLKPRHLDAIVSRTVRLDDLMPVFQPLVDGKATGRTLVEIGAG